MMKRFTGLILTLMIILINSLDAHFIQQGNKLVGSGAAGAAGQGTSVSISSDGNTAIVGGNGDNGGQGAAWIFTRQYGVWTQQGNKLVGSGAVGAALQGTSVSISSDGNTAIVGGYGDNGGQGAAWVFTRQNGVWTQQGNKLVGSGAVGGALQGWSVSISSDGNTAVVGGKNDNSALGAAWIFTRQNGVWTQQGNKLVGSGAVGVASQGTSVSISSDGNTAIVGGPVDNKNLGAAWIFIRQNGIWTQQGGKLIGTGAGGNAQQGYSVSISSYGNTAVVGGKNDNIGQGAAWIFTRQNGVWTQQGNKLVGSGAVGMAFQGWSVSISSDGNTAIVGGYGDNNYNGAAWVFTRQNGVWTQQGNKLVGSGAAGMALQGWSVSISSDGNTAVVGGNNDNSHLGAAWIFARAPHKITASASSGGSISPNGNLIVIYGGSITFNITPDKYFVIKDVVVDGVSKGAISTYTFTNVREDHTISASFNQVLINISGKVTLNGTGIKNVSLFIWDQNGIIYSRFTSSATTDASGNYSFTGVPASDGLKVYLMEPFGYAADKSSKDLPAIGLNNPSITGINFTLTKSLTENQAQPSAYWASQFKYYAMHTGTVPPTTESQLLGYIDAVQKHYTHYFNIFQYKLSILDWYLLFDDSSNPEPGLTKTYKEARFELAALLLNIASQKLPQYLSVTKDNRTAGEALTEISKLVMDGIATNDQTASTYAYKINTKQTLAKNTIPQSDLLYKTGSPDVLISSAAPDNFKLYNNYPNPFNPSTKISYAIPFESNVKLTVYNPLGKVVRELVNGLQQQGVYEVRFDAGELPSGLYFYAIDAKSPYNGQEFKSVKKMLLVK